MFNWIGFAFVSEDIPNCETLEEMIGEKCDELKDNAQCEFNEWLDSLGLELVMGVVVKKKSIK